MRMPFGKYRGLAVADVPPEYLFWLYRNGEIEPELRGAIADVLRGLIPARDRPVVPRPAGVDGREAARREVLAALKAAYREMAMRHHPDRGGSHQAMIGVNALYERLEELLGRPG
jgi:Putative quorum-sensing-regulated virulence factor